MLVKRVLLVAGVIILALSSKGMAETAYDIIQKSEDLIRAKSSISEMTMQVVKPDWSRTVSMKAWALEPDYSLILITKPAKEKGMVTLKRFKEVWNYIPKIRKLIKIPPSMMMQSWMGSDFTNDDLVKESSITTDYDQKIIGEETLEGYDCYKIELIPKPDVGVVWGKIITWISKDGYLQLKSSFYDEDGFLVKYMRGSDIREIGGRVIPARIEMIPEDKPGHKTVIEYHDIEFNPTIEASFFSERNMKRVR